ncbi:toxin-antitoxin system, toxin component [Streptomyces seoulensis]|uniref:toxin-antitoxin system, toxin component n=1 Tax=Streptomyces seoulensis TaxID=73044 RepID=UPI0033B9C81C
MRRLRAELVGQLDRLPAPVPPEELYRSLCSAMSRRRGRPVHFRTSVFPPGTASGLWLDMSDRDLVVVEQRTAPDHQLVILGHELWHMQTGHAAHRADGLGVGVATRLLTDDTDRDALRAAVHRVAARTRFDQDEERDAETFGLLLASKCRTRMRGSSLSGPVRRDDVVGRIGTSLGYPGPQG